VRGFANAIPKDRVLVLDLVADDPSRAIWRYPPSPTMGPFAQNISLIWCALSNWGGAVHVGGDISLVLAETRAAMKSSQVVGVGLTPEGIDNNPAYFSLVLDSAWTTQPSAESWLEEWGRGRCGALVPEAQQAYALLYETVYKPGTPYLWCCALPRYCPTVMPGQPVDRAAYNITLLQKALELMVTAAPKCDTEAFRYDLVDVAREWLSYGACIDRLSSIKLEASPVEINATTHAFLEVTDDIDTMLKTNRGFLLGSWLNGSRSVADWDGSGPATRNPQPGNPATDNMTMAG
jgi:alpha-N-acetylglucosaminidase